MAGETYYQILGVSETATDKEIKNAYRRLAVLYHPDKVEHLGPRLKNLAEDELKKLNGAKSVLLDSDKRDKYDSEIGIVTSSVAETPSGLKIDWGTVAEEFEIKQTNGTPVDGEYLYCNACGHPNLKTDELCQKCGVQFTEFQQVELSLNERIHILEDMLQSTNLTPIKFFEAIRNLESWYLENNKAARERSMEKRIEILTEKFKNKELTPEKYFEAITNLREWWQR